MVDLAAVARTLLQCEVQLVVGEHAVIDDDCINGACVTNR
jgi:hypothetical protein